MSDGKVVFDITGDTGGLDSALNKATQSIRSHSSKWDNMMGEVKTGLKQAFSFSAGQLIADGVQQAMAAIKQFAGESIEMASSLEEVQNVVDTTFGSDARSIDTWAKNAKKSFGMGELAAKKYSGTMGSMLKSMGLNGKQVTTMSKGMVALAGDMASFYNLDHETAFEKIRSGISGETEPLKQLGINMSVANLEAYAMSQGITKAYNAMTQAEQATLRYNYLLSVTSDAQGDFARTSSGYANATRTLEENINTVKANLGDFLLPLVTDVVNSVNALFDNGSLSSQMAEIDKTMLGELSNVEAQSAVVKTLVDDLTQLEGKSSLTTQEQEQWNAILAKLVQTIPSLSSVIDVQTGKIEGGTQAILDHAAAWAADSEAQIRAQALTDKRAALETTRANLITLEVDQKAVQSQLNSYEAELQAAADNLEAIWPQFNPDNIYNWDTLLNYRGIGQLSEAQKEAVRAYREVEARVVPIIGDLKQENDQLNTSIATTSAEYEEQAARLAIIEEQMYGTAEAAAAAATAETEYTTSLTNAQGYLEQAETAVSALTQRYNEAKAAALEQVEATLGGFEKMSEVKKRSVNDVITALKSQQDYMEEYSKNLQIAAEKGVDEGLIAALSDGSKESAAILAGIATASKNQVAKLNEEFGKTSDAKETLAANMAEAELAMDAEFQSMKDDVDSMVASFNQEMKAMANAMATGTGAAQGLANALPSIQAQCDLINAAIAGAFSVDAPQLNIPGTLVTPDGSHRNGLDRVPFDGYLAQLHKDESVLTADESIVWRRLMNGGLPAASAAAPIDYDRLGAAVATSMRGIAVEMDGQTVGQLVYPTVSHEMAQEATYRRYG